MTMRRLLAAFLVLAAPVALAAPMASAQSATPPATPPQEAAPPPGPQGWGPRQHGWYPGGPRFGHRDHWGRGDGLLSFGMWWKDPQMVAWLGLTTEQQKRVSDMFLQSRLQLIHLHATLQEQQLMLGPLLDATPFDESKAVMQIDKIADTRAELEKTDAKMLLDIRSVLTAEQWTKLRDRRFAMHGSGAWNHAGPDGGGATGKDGGPGI